MTGTMILAAAMALAPAQAGGLALANPRPTYCALGPTRTDMKYLPGELFYLAFDIEGLKASEDGRVTYNMGMEVIDRAGKVIFNAPPAKASLLVPLGGGKLPGHVYVSIGPDMAAGSYTAKLTVTDTAAPNTPKTLEHKFEVLPVTFGLVGIFFSIDEGGNFPVGMTGVAGQTVYVNVALVGFTRDATKKPNSAIEFRVLDESGKPTQPKPIVVPVPKDLKENDQFVPFQLQLPLNREGNFTLEVSAADKLSGKSTALKLPFRVHAASK